MPFLRAVIAHKKTNRQKAKKTDKGHIDLGLDLGEPLCHPTDRGTSHLLDEWGLPQSLHPALLWLPAAALTAHS